MRGVAREGDIENKEFENEDTMDITSPPESIFTPKQESSSEDNTSEDTEDSESSSEDSEIEEPKMEVYENKPAEGIGCKTVFCNGMGVLVAGTDMKDRTETIYERTFHLDESGELTGEYTDKMLSKKSTKVRVISGSSSVFAEGLPLSRIDDLLEEGESSSEEVSDEDAPEDTDVSTETMGSFSLSRSSGDLRIKTGSENVFAN